MTERRRVHPAPGPASGGHRKESSSPMATTTLPSGTLTITTEHGATLLTVRLAGEFDLSAVGEFRAAIDAAAVAQPLAVDLSAVSYVDSSGIAALVGAHRRAGGALTLVGPL